MAKDKAVTDLIKTIEGLKKEEKDLLERKANLVNEINKPIHEAKGKADKMLADAEFKSKELIDSANKYKTDNEDRLTNLLNEAKELMAGANRKLNGLSVDKDNLEKDITNFNASRFAFESNVKIQKNEADAALGKAIQLQTELSRVKVTLDNRESNVNRKTEELQEVISRHTKIIEGSKEKVKELRVQEQSLVDQKTELLCLKNGNEEILAKVKAETSKLSMEKEITIKNLEEIKKVEKEIEKTKNENAVILSSIANEKEELAEQTKTLRERERVLSLTERTIDKKINNLNKLRAADNKE